MLISLPNFFISESLNRNLLLKHLIEVSASPLNNFLLQFPSQKILWKIDWLMDMTEMSGQKLCVEIWHKNHQVLVGVSTMFILVTVNAKNSPSWLF